MIFPLSIWESCDSACSIYQWSALAAFLLKNHLKNHKEYHNIGLYWSSHELVEKQRHLHLFILISTNCDLKNLLAFAKLY